MESRLSTILGCQVEIGASKISLLDGTIALEDIHVLPATSLNANASNKSNAPIKIARAALRFDWNSVLYRNMTVENMIVSDVQWTISSPPSDEIPSAESVPTVSLFENVLAPSEASLGLVESVLKPIRGKINVESSRQSQSQLDISARLEALAVRIQEMSPAEGAVNPLRQRSLVDEVRRDINKINQAIVQDRLDRKNADKDLQSMRKLAKDNLMATIDAENVGAADQIRDQAVSLATTAVANEWNGNRAVLGVALRTIALLDSDTPSSSGYDEAANRFLSKRSDRHPLANLPDRITKLEAGKLRGIASLDSSNSQHTPYDFEMRLNHLSNRQIAGKDGPSMHLQLSRTLDTAATPVWSCVAEQVVLPQSDTTQVQIQLQHHLEGVASTTQIQHANHGWSSTLSVPTASCLSDAMKYVDNGQAVIANASVADRIKAKLIATTNPKSSSVPSSMIIEIDPESLLSLESALLGLKRAYSDSRRATLETRSTEMLNDELLRMSTRWNQLDDEHSRVHASWEESMKDLSSRMEELEITFKRTSRLNDATKVF
jgi:hypothetical protein